MKKWYKSKGCKGILIGAFHIAAIAIMVILTDLFAFNGLDPSLFMGYLAGEKYEDTLGFEERMMYTSYENAMLPQYQAYFEEGILKNQAIDITEEMPFINTMKILDEPRELVIIEGSEIIGGLYNGEGVLYNGEDLLEWAKSQTGIYSNKVEDMIVVCQEESGDYAYYYYGEFRELVQEKKLTLTSEAKETSKVILRNMEDKYYADREYTSPIQVFDEQENIKYEYCWTMEMINERYLPINGKSLLDIAGTQEHWNGRLRELITGLDYMLMDITFEYSYYLGMKDNPKEETNLTYMLVDLKNEQVYSNVEKYTDFKQYEENLDSLERYGKYIKVVPETRQGQTNLEKMKYQGWEYDFLDNLLSEDYIYIAAVDTSFPIRDDFYEQKMMYEALVSPNQLIGMVIMFFVSLAWLTIVAGRTPESEEVVLNSFDRMKSEVACAIILAIGGVFMLTAAAVSGQYYWNSMNELLKTFVGVFTFGISATALTGYLSFVRRIKARTLWKNSLLKWLCGYVKQFFEFAKEVFQHRKSTTKVIVVFGGILLLITIGIASYSAGSMFLAFIAGCAFILNELKVAIGTQKIRDGLQAIVEGNLDYQIPVEKMTGDQKEIAERINSMGEGLERAVEKSMKDERMKTELITNVSHDIKTPLTSIINYVDLLKRENFQDEKIQGYLKILEEKAQRLKTLTEDVVEASKVTSGNIQLEFVVVNLVEMIQQSEGEFEEKFKERNLKFVMSYPQEPVLVNVDGKYMWRVLENLFSNVAKYAMEGTRVYGELQASAQNITFSIKNVSATQLNITAEELTERFIRGDEARTTEGNGLGLSIAKSLVELQDGKMSLVIDGDLFKATIELKKVTN